MPASPVSLENTQEALQHVQFQLSLLRLTSAPTKYRGPEATPLSESGYESAEDRIEEMALVASGASRF